MSQLHVKQLNVDSSELDAALKLYVDTFQTETITSYNINFDHPKTIAQYYDAVQLIGRVFLTKGDDILAAKLADEVVALALIDKGNKASFSDKARVLFPEVFKLLPLLTKINYRNMISSGKVMDLSSPLKGNYVTLQIIAVSSNHQGQGFGKRFIEEIHRHYSKQYDGIYLYTGDRPTKEIYEHFGYELIEITSSKDLDVYHMVYDFQTNQLLSS